MPSQLRTTACVAPAFKRVAATAVPLLQSSLDHTRSLPLNTNNSTAPLPRSRRHGTVPELRIVTVNRGEVPTG